MRVLSLFSGAGGDSLGMEAAGHQIVGMCEIDPIARSVLARHWPGIPIHDDVTSLDATSLKGEVDLVLSGSPCQDLSVAGGRAGLAGSRSGLFWHQLRIADECAAPWLVWENVAGALSSRKGEDFAAVLWGFTGVWPEVPKDGWRSSGVCVGPRRVAVWRLLDARYFGVPQRRRRVFVVVGPRGECGPEVLFEPESSPGRPQQSRREGTEVAALTAAGVGTCGADDNQAQAGHLIPVRAFHLTQTPIDTVDFTPTLSLHLRGTIGVAYPLAVSENQRAEVRLTDYFRSLTVGGGKPGQGYPAVLTPELAVRRLTPRECERLMGWPDDWTRWTADGKEIADSHRYRMCGNGCVSHEMEWIGRRLPTRIEARRAA